MVTRSNGRIFCQHDRFFHHDRPELGDHIHHRGHGPYYPIHQPFHLFIPFLFGQHPHPINRFDCDPTDQCDHADSFGGRRRPDHPIARLHPTVAQRDGGGRADQRLDPADC
ncbi:MAG TPA: hypothetical protein VG226_01390 [Acidimicrobiales bacterium]|jgi:hypothetical protein|nr:hypothetical protein [Acidimicrobiales bacterium]